MIRSQNVIGIRNNKKGQRSWNKIRGEEQNRLNTMFLKSTPINHNSPT